MMDMKKKTFLVQFIAGICGLTLLVYCVVQQDARELAVVHAPGLMQ